MLTPLPHKSGRAAGIDQGGERLHSLSKFVFVAAA